MSEQVEQHDVTTRDGRTLRVHDTHPGDDGRTVVVWHHGTPNVGAPPTPLRAASDRLGLRWIGHDRPGYGGSDPQPGRTVADDAADVADLADALGVGRFLVMGHSGGGPRALACAALLGDRVLATAAVSSPAPFDAEGLDFFAGMAPAGVAEHRAAAQGRAALEALGDDEQDIGFTPGDGEALGGRWAWFLEVVRAATAGSPEGALEDALSSVRPWGFDVADVASPLLVVHGEADRMVPPAHSRWLADRGGAELWLRPGDGHVTVMDAGEDVLEWLADRAGR